MIKVTAFSLLLFTISAAYAQDNLDLNKSINSVDSSNIFISNDYYIWGASVIKGGDKKFHMFYSRWKHGPRTEKDDSLNYIFDGFRGWNKYSEIAYAVSDKLTGPYKHVSTVLKGTGNKNLWNRFTYHNPHIRFFDGYYYLYFISNSFDSSYALNEPSTKESLQWLKYNCSQKVGVVKAKSIEDILNGNYEKPLQYIMAPDNKQTFEVATNPTVTEGPDGKYYMMYKSRRPNVGHMTFWMAIADKPDGPYKTISAVLTTSEMACEDPSIWYDKKRKRFYAAAKYFSNAKVLAPEFGALVLITSENGLNWQPAHHSLISLKQLRVSTGEITKLKNLERPFVVVDEKGQPVALFAAAAVLDPFESSSSPPQDGHNTFNVHIPLTRQ